MLQDVLVPAVAFLPLVVVVAWFDLRHLRIPNAAVLLGLAIFLATSPLPGFGESLTRLAAAGVIFVICLGLWAMNVFGGGDAKFLPLLFLFVPSSMLTTYVYLLSAGMLAGLLTVGGLRLVARADGSAWKSLRPGAEFPMGVAMAAAHALLLAVLLHRALQGTG
ncbi:hypothetical protein HKCCE3408_00925 [Rhodobacterales bacterium HKCCE3408]|nr:hypothetical protein [Rhodobacterales bacterium HKCCE3408]